MCESSKESENETNKWKCEYCTYKNFPSSLKCTMCKGPKPLINEDIYRLSPSSQQECEPIDINDSFSNTTTSNTIKGSTEYKKNNNYNSDSSFSGTSAQQELNNQVHHRNTWICNICTFMNSIKSVRCTQCCSRRDNQDRISDNEDVCGGGGGGGRRSGGGGFDGMNNELTDINISGLSINDENITGSDIIEIGNRISPTICNSQNNSTNTENVSSKNNGAISRIANLNEQPKKYFINKWLCSFCTYENWPKSIKCSMCGQIKDYLIYDNDTAASTTKQILNQTNYSDDRLNDDFNCAGKMNTINNNNNNKNNHSNNNNNNMVASTNKRNSNISYLYYNQNNNNNKNDLQNNCDSIQERRMRQIKRQLDFKWLNACVGVVENNLSAVEEYLTCGGSPSRSLTSNEVVWLNRDSAYDVGHTLIHLAIRFHREDMLPMLLAQISGSGPGLKRVPSYIAPDLASDIRRYFSTCLRMRKSKFNCNYINEHATFALPYEIDKLPTAIQEQLYDELLDRDAQQQLESTPPAINWSLEVIDDHRSRLMVLWNRSAGDCLLDSAMQATWGVFDRDNVLRQALADSLNHCGHTFYTRWKEYEMIQAASLDFTIEEAQCEEDFATLISLANQPGSSLEQLHIFVLAHILRRPIIVYGVKYVKSFRGEDIGFARFEGLYLPLFWEQSFCIKSPIALGYTRGHFSALVPRLLMDETKNNLQDTSVLPLMDCEHKLLPIPFLTQSEMGHEEAIMHQWLDITVTSSALLMAKQQHNKRPLLVDQMVEEWLNHYRRIAQAFTAPFTRHPQIPGGYSSDGDTDEE